MVTTLATTWTFGTVLWSLLLFFFWFAFIWMFITEMSLEAALPHLPAAGRPAPVDGDHFPPSERLHR